MTKKITSILVALIGIVVIVFGFLLRGEQVYHYVKDVGTFYEYDVPGYSFGADFYTHIYDANDTIVSELNDVITVQNSLLKASAKNVEAMDSVANAVYEVGGTLVMVIGVAIFAVGLINIGKAFTRNAPEKVVVSTPASDELPDL